MSKLSRIILLISIILTPLMFYNYINGSRNSKKADGGVVSKDKIKHPGKKPEIALIFDDLGESLKELKDVYSLEIPLTIAVIPDRKFSKNIAYTGYRCGYSVLIHLPMEPKGDPAAFVKMKDEFIGRHLPLRKIKRLLRNYLNYFQIAIGVNNHMGSKATEDEDLVRIVLAAVKRKNLVFVDSRTSLKSCVCEVAKELEVECAANEGFLDSIDEVNKIREKIHGLVEKARKKGKIIVIAHPKENTFKALRKELPSLKREVKFITLKEYFDL